MHAVREQRRKTHDRRSKRFCIDKHSHSEKSSTNGKRQHG
jgi:hypothetical protein